MYVGRDFSEVNVGEKIPLTFDFVNDIPEGPTITSVVWACAVATGNDPNASDCIIGDPLIEGTKVTQEFYNFKAGVKYLVTATVTLSDGSKYVLYSHVPCREEV